MDLVSLYLEVTKYDVYPVEHTGIIMKDFKDIEKYFHLAK